MFNVTGNFQNGVYSSGMVNGYQAKMLQEEQDVGKVIRTAEVLIKAGYNPYSDGVLKIFKEAGVSLEDIDDFNLKRIVRKVEQIWESKNNGI